MLHIAYNTCSLQDMYTDCRPIPLAGREVIVGGAGQWNKKSGGGRSRNVDRNTANG